jgi:Tfp pilus assembly protein PilF
MPLRRRRASADDLARKPDLYYQGLALQKLGKTEEAKAVFQGLVTAGQQALTSQKIASGPEMTPRACKALAHYITGLGYLGLNDQAGAKAELSQAVQTDPGLAQARVALATAVRRS